MGDLNPMDAEIAMNNIISWQDLYRYLPEVAQKKDREPGRASERVPVPCGTDEPVFSGR